MEKSSIKLVSNIMLKSKFKKTADSYISYLPFDLLPRVYSDVRSENDLTEYQKVQKLKKLFAADRFIEEPNNNE